MLDLCINPCTCLGLLCGILQCRLPNLSELLLQAIDGLEADVLTIENSRSGNEMINALAKYGYSRDIGPGVYDVHSPVVPR